jgi:hypothetical protein
MMDYEEKEIFRNTFPEPGDVGRPVSSIAGFHSLASGYGI